MTAILGSAAFVAGLAFGWPVPYALASLALVAVLCRRDRLVVASVMVVCAVAGDLRGTSVVERAAILESVDGAHEGAVARYSRHYGDSQRFTVRVNGFDVCATAEQRLNLGRGDIISFVGTIEPRASQAPGRLAALIQLGCDGSVAAAEIRVIDRGEGVRRWIEDRRRRLVDWFSATVPGDEGVLLAGLVVGDDYDLSFGAREDFLDLGMSHITAVSGSNLALLTWLLLRPGAKRRAWGLEAVLLSGLWFYVLLAGAGPSTVRAGLTATLAVAAKRSGRKPELLSIACLVAAGQVGVEPQLLDNLAYRLSTIAMLIMITTLAGRPGEGAVQKVMSLTLCSVAIQLATTTFVPQRDQAILAGIVANVLAAPLVALAFALALVAAVLQPISESVATAVATVGELGTGAILDLASAISGSRLARMRPSPVDRLPLNLLRALLISGIVTVFGRHVRRGIGDVWRGVMAMSGNERAVWAGAGVGVLAGAVGILLLR